MRVQSILSSFSIVLGNYVLHLILAILTYYTTDPDQVELETLLAALPKGSQQCASVDVLR